MKLLKTIPWLLLALALSTRMSRVITDPLLRLSEIARQITTQKNYSLRVIGREKDELGDLIADFNAMLDEIQSRDIALEEHKSKLEERVLSADGWVVTAPVHLSLVTLRYAPGDLDGQELDALNRRILDRVNASGEAFLTHTVLDGRVVLRIAIGNLKTTWANVERVWTLLQHAAREEAPPTT